GVLQLRRGDLHASGTANRWVRDIPVTTDLIARVDDYDALPPVVGQHPRHLAQDRRLADTRTPEQQDALAGLDQVLNDRQRAEDCAPDAAGQADDLPGAIANRRDAMQRALDPGAVVASEAPDALGDVGDILARHLTVGQGDLTLPEAGLWNASQVEHELNEVGQRIGFSGFVQRALQVGRQDGDQFVEVVGDARRHPQELLLTPFVRPLMFVSYQDRQF